jgi:CMP-N-acetylneuraminic acid synthetase
MSKLKMFLIIKSQSERVEGKNFREIGGMPLHLYFMMRRHNFEIYIDTDSERIFEEYSSDKWPNIVVYMRHQAHIDIEKSGFTSPAPLMIKRFLDEYVTDENEAIVTSHITSPFLEDSSVLAALEKMKEKNFDSVSSVEDIQEFCVFGGANDVKPINFDNNSIVKTQSLEPIKVLNGAFFIIKKKIFLTNGNRRISDNHHYFSLSKFEAIDIDTEFDLSVARSLAQK